MIETKTFDGGNANEILVFSKQHYVRANGGDLRFHKDGYHTKIPVPIFPGDTIVKGDWGYRLMRKDNPYIIYSLYVGLKFFAKLTHDYRKTSSIVEVSPHNFYEEIVLLQRKPLLYPLSEIGSMGSMIGKKKVSLFYKIADTIYRLRAQEFDSFDSVQVWLSHLIASNNGEDMPFWLARLFAKYRVDVDGLIDKQMAFDSRIFLNKK